MFLSRSIRIIKLFLCSLLFFCCIVGFRVCNVSKLSHLSGARLFYLYSPSSQATIKEKLSLLDCFFIKGESVSLVLENDGDLQAKNIIKQSSAKLLLIEQAGGVCSYYAYSKNLGDGVVVNGQKVNLHVAISGERLVVGTPIIFGGF